MNYNIKGTDITISPEIREYLDKKLGFLDKFLPNLDAARADVELQFLRGEAKTYRAEFMVHDPAFKSVLRAEARGFALHEAIDLCVGEISQELTRTKKKRLHVLRHSALRVKEYLRGWRRKV